MKNTRNWRSLLLAISALLLASLACAGTTPQTSAPPATNPPAATQAMEASPTTETAAEEGELIFEDQFADNTNNWPLGKNEYSDAQIADGKYKIYIPTDGYNWFNSSVAVSEVDVTVDAEYVEGELEYSDFGIMCRILDNDNFYRFRIGADGLYRIDKMLNGELSVLVDWKKSNAITTGVGGVNKIRANCSGEHLTLYVNDELLADVVDSSHEGGYFALMVGAYKKDDGTLTPVAVNFSNLIVRKP